MLIGVEGNRLSISVNVHNFCCSHTARGNFKKKADGGHGGVGGSVYIKATVRDECSFSCMRCYRKKICVDAGVCTHGIETRQSLKNSCTHSHNNKLL